MERGRQILSNLAPVKRPDFSRSAGPLCNSCGTALSEGIIETMEIHGIKYCPVCILEDVHPLANPLLLTNTSSRDELESRILDAYGAPPEEVQSENMPFPGTYILWSPGREEDLSRVLEISRLGKFFTSLLKAANGNGIIYIGESRDLVGRVWNHHRGGAALVTQFMMPTRLVAVNWKPPDVNLKNLEEKVGRQVASAVEENGYNMEVYWD